MCHFWATLYVNMSTRIQLKQTETMQAAVKAGILHIIQLIIDRA